MSSDIKGILINVIFLRVEIEMGYEPLIVVSWKRLPGTSNIRVIRLKPRYVHTCVSPSKLLSSIYNLLYVDPFTCIFPMSGHD